MPAVNKDFPWDKSRTESNLGRTWVRLWWATDYGNRLTLSFFFFISFWVINSYSFEIKLFNKKSYRYFAPQIKREGNKRGHLSLFLEERALQTVWAHPESQEYPSTARSASPTQPGEKDGNKGCFGQESSESLLRLAQPSAEVLLVCGRAGARWLKTLASVPLNCSSWAQILPPGRYQFAPLLRENELLFRKPRAFPGTG